MTVNPEHARECACLNDISCADRHSVMAGIRGLSHNAARTRPHQPFEARRGVQGSL